MLPYFFITALFLSVEINVWYLLSLLSLKYPFNLLVKKHKGFIAFDVSYGMWLIRISLYDLLSTYYSFRIGAINID